MLLPTEMLGMLTMIIEPHTAHIAINMVCWRRIWWRGWLCRTESKHTGLFEDQTRATLFLMTTPMGPLARCAAISSPATAAALAQLAQPFAVRECITDASFAEFTILRNERCIAQFNFSQACLFTYPSYMAVAHRTSDDEASEVIGVIGVICDYGITRKDRTIVLST